MKDQNVWDLGGGWKVALSTETPEFGRCENSISGEVADFATLRERLYGTGDEGWLKSIADAIEHGKSRHGS
jgi:hypothetical protein